MSTSKIRAPKLDIGKVANNLLGKFLTEDNISRMIPVIAQRYLAGNPMMAQMGITPEVLAGLTAPQLEAGPGEDPEYPEIPSGGAWKLVRGWNKLEQGEVMMAIERILFKDEGNFGGVAEGIANAIWLAIGLNAIERSEAIKTQESGDNAGS